MAEFLHQTVDSLASKFECVVIIGIWFVMKLRHGVVGKVSTVDV